MHVRQLAAVALFAVVGCKPAAVSVSIAGGVRAFSASVFTQCLEPGDRLSSVEIFSEPDCFDIPAGGGRVDLVPIDDVPSPLSCAFGLTIFDRCAAPLPPGVNPNEPGVVIDVALQLLSGSADAVIHDSVEPTDVVFRDLSRAFDDDQDGYSNYLEWSESTDPQDTTSTPTGAPDL